MTSRRLLRILEMEHRQSQLLLERLERLGLSWDEYRRGYLAPNAAVLARYAATGDPRLYDIYLDERHRLFREPPATPGELAELQRLLESDAAATGIPEPAGTTLAAGDVRPVRVMAVGDCLLGETRAFLRGMGARRGQDVYFDHLYMSARMGRGLAPSEETRRRLADEHWDVVAFSFLTYEGIPPYQAFLADAPRLSDAEVDERAADLAALMRGYLQPLRDVSDRPFLLHNACGLPLRTRRRLNPLVPALAADTRRALKALNGHIGRIAGELENTILIDEVDVTRHGLRAAARPFLPRRVTKGAQFHTSRFGVMVAERYLEVIDALNSLGRTKVLALDMDNTLWDGVMAEGEVSHHEDRQRLLRELQECGILLVAVSKNDPGSIRWDEMLLQPEHFALLKVSWDQKATAIEEAAHQLNLGRDSFVLVDDNPAERHLVEQAHPEVRTLDATDEGTWRWLRWMLEFPNTGRTEEARQRTATYRAAAARQEVLSGPQDYAAMMESLGLRATLRVADRKDLTRVRELMHRTNQFNTTTLRPSVDEVKEMAAGGGHGLYVATLADRFADLGLVAVVLVRRDPPGIVIEDVVMSCRAMGFGFEYLMLRRVLEAEMPWSVCRARIVATDRNGPVRDLFAEAGFQPTGAGEWTLDDISNGPEVPAWFADLSEARLR